jgi:hypothetical protein
VGALLEGSGVALLITSLVRSALGGPELAASSFTTGGSRACGVHMRAGAGPVRGLLLQAQYNSQVLQR